MKILMMGAALVGVLALSACGRTAATNYWYQPETSASQTAYDQRQCQRAANKYLDQNDSFDADINDGGYSAMMDGYESRSRYKELVSDCMTRMGYSARK